MKFFNLMDKGRWPRGPWNQEPDMVLFQVRRRGLTYTCVIKRARDAGALLGYILVPDEHPLSSRNTAAMIVIMAMDAGLSLGQTYAFSIRTPSRSIAPAHFDPAYTYFTVDNWKEIILAKVNELDAATKAEQERIAVRQAAEASGQPVPDDDIFGDDVEDEYEEEEEEEEEDDDERTPDEDDEAAIAVTNTPQFLTSDQIFSTPQTPQR
jgi:hypothetical protein